MKRSEPAREHVVRINDSAGGGHPDPFQLRLWPGENVSVALRVVNLGDPTNLSVRVEGGLGSALRARKANHYIVLEETIELVACLPPGSDVLRGEILLRSDFGTSRIPVTMISDLDGATTQKEEDFSAGFVDLPLVQEDHQDRPSARPAPQARAEEDDSREDETVEEEPILDRPAGGQSSRRYPWPDQNPSTSSIQEDPEPPQDSYRPQREEPGPRQEVYERYTPPEDLFRPGRIRDKKRLLALPAVLMAALLLVLALTFYTRSIPEFPGAMASSMLIVTLIIYGAATLLKA